MAMIDVVIPSYNYGSYLETCVRSVLAQNVASMRVLIIDNASTDDSVAIARALAKKDPRVVLCLRATNEGPHASFNAGVDWAEAKYLLILCADDLLAPGALTRAVAIMERHPHVDLAYGRTEFVSADFFEAQERAEEPSTYSLWERPKFLEEFCRTGRNPVGGPTALVRTKVQKRLGHYRPELVHTDDAEMWMRFAAAGDIAQLDAVHLYARVHERNQSVAVSNVHQWNLEMEQAFDVFFNNAGASLANRDRLLRMARHSLGDRAYLCAFSHVMRGEPGAVELMRFALRLKPVLAVAPPLGSLMRRRDARERIGATLRALMSTRLARRVSSH